MLPVTITLRRAAARAARYAPHMINANNQRLSLAASVQLAQGQLHKFHRVASFTSAAIPERDELEQDVEAETEIVLEPLNGFVGQKGIEEFNFSPTLLSNLVNAEITHLFPVQAQSFQVMMDGSDIVGRSKTGSGKTLAFGLPIVEKLLNSPKSREPRALILLPTRELSMQVADAIKKIAPQLRIVNVVGGVSYTTQENQLRRGADILVGTPGRITDLVDKGSLVLDEVEVAVLDEADMMLKFGFQEAVETILGYVTKTDSQTVMWSATFPKWVSTMAKKFTKNAVNIDLVGREDTHVPATVNHKAIHAPNRSRVRILENVLRHHARGGQTLIFTETKQEADQIANELSGEVRALHGDLSQGMRTSTMEGFRNGSIKTLVCTDIAARGLDIADVELVVQYRLPNDKESFVHRAGRTGRAGRSGTNLVFFDRQDAGEILDIERRYKLTFNHAAAPRVEHMLGAAISDISKKMAGVPKAGVIVFKAAAEQMHAEQGVNALSSALALLAGFDNDQLSAFSMLTGRPKMQTVEVGGVKNARDVQMVLSKVVDRVSSSDIHSVDGKFVFDIPHDSMDKVHKMFVDAGAEDATIFPVVEVSRVLVSANSVRDNGGQYGGRRGFGGDRRGGNSFGGYGNNDRRGGGGFSSRRNYDNNNRGGNRDYDSSFSFGSKKGGFGERSNGYNRERSFSRSDNGRQSPRSSRGSSNKSNSFLDNW